MKYDVYLNVAGGLRIVEPAADLAVAAAIISAAKNDAINMTSIFMGEIGLAGEVRSVGQMMTRLKEAEKLGFEKAYMPPMTSKKKQSSDAQSDITIKEIKDITALIPLIAKS